MDTHQLTALIARGDRRTAASMLVRQHAPAVFALCRAMVRDTPLAEDLSQDVFARAFGALEGFRGEASPRTWLLKIARHRCLDHLARARRDPARHDEELDLDGHPSDVPPPYDLLSRREDAARAIEALGESERALVVLHFGHGVGYPELADSFGLNQGAVRMRISRALARMRSALHALEREDDDLEMATSEASAELDFDDDLAESSLASASSSFTTEDTLDELAAMPDEATFDSLRDELSGALWTRLDRLVARQ